MACSSLTVTDDGGPAPATPYDPAVVNVNGTDYIVSQTPFILNFPNNNPVISYQYYDNIAGASAGSRYVWTGTVFTYELMVTPENKPIAEVFTLPTSGWWELTACYKLQQQVTFIAGTGGTSSPGAGAYWYDNGSSVPIVAAPQAPYIFLRWSVTGGLSVADEYAPSTALTVGGSGTVEPVFTASYVQVDFCLAGIGGDATGSVFMLDGGSREASAFNFSLSLEEGSVHSFAWSSPVSGTSGTRYVWTSSSGLSEAQSGSITVPSGSCSLTGIYETQYFTTISAGVGGSVNASSGWFDASGTVMVAATPSTGYAFVNWVTTGGVMASDPDSPTTLLTVNGAGSANAVFQLVPVLVSFSQSGIGEDFSGAVVNVDGAPILRGDLTKAYSWAVGSNHNFAWLSPLAVSPDKQFVWVSTSGLSTAQSGSINVSMEGSIAGSYKVQYYVAISAGSGGSVNRTSGWQDASSTSAIAAIAGPLYGFSGWVTTGGVSVSDPDSPTTTMTVTGAGTIEATFALLPVTVAFNQSGVAADFTGAVLNVDGTTVMRSELAKSYSWIVGSEHSFSWLSPLVVSTDKRYVWASASGLSTAQSGMMTIPSGGGGLNGNFKAQFNVMISAGAGGTVDKASGWYDASTAVPVTATPIGGYAFKSWVVTGGISVSNPNSASATMTVTSAGTLQATFELLPVGVSFMQSGIGAEFSGAVLEVDGVAVQLSELMKTYSWSVGSEHAFYWLSPLTVSGEARYVWASTSGFSTAQSGSVTVPSGAGYISGEYKAQYYVTISSTAGGGVNESSAWRDGLSLVDIAATPAAGYAFKMWVTSGNVTISNISSMAATIAVEGVGSVEAVFEMLPVEVLFLQLGIGTDYAGGVLEVDGAVAQLSELPKAFSWDVGSSHGYSWLSPLLASAEKRYVWVSTSGPSALQSGSVVTPSAAGSVVGGYMAEYRVIAGASAGGATSLSSSGWYRDGMVGFVTATPSSGYRFANWTAKGGVSVNNASATSTTFTVNGPGEIVANFVYAPDSATVTFLSSAGGTTSPSGAESYGLGSTVEITASPSYGYEFAGWTVVGGASLGDLSTPSTTMTVEGEATVTASFRRLEVPSHEITFIASVGGTVYPSGSGSYLEGSSVGISAAPTVGYRFTGWTVDGDAEVADPESGTTVLTVNGPAVVTAVFEPIGDAEFTVIFLANAGGTVSPSGSISYAGVTTVAITATPEEGHVFSTWNVTGDIEIANSTGSSTTVTVNGHGTVTAHFHPESDLPVEELSPANGSTVSEGQVKILASFPDWLEIDPSTVVLVVDGIEVSGVEVTEGGVSYHATLGPGAHTVELTAKDYAGKTKTARWDVNAYQPFAMSWWLYAAIAIEIAMAGIILFLWLKGRGPRPVALRPGKRTVVR